MYNVGITDIKRASRLYPRVYRLWEHILRRCYSNNSLEKRPSYQNTVVCDRWLIFSNFLNDIKFVPGFDYWWQNPNCQISLDKDILGDGTIYSLNTCVFVPKSFNSKICRLTYGNDTLIKNSKGFVKPIIMFTIDMYPIGVYISIYMDYRPVHSEIRQSFKTF